MKALRSLNLINTQLKQTTFVHCQLTSLSFLNLPFPSFTGGHRGMAEASQDNSKNMNQENNSNSNSNSKAGSELRYSDHIMPHLLNLYGERPRARDFEIYADNATFEDPLMCAHGVKQIKSAFYTMPKIFSDYGIVEYNIKEEIISPGKHEILIDNKQHYKLWGRNIDMISLIVLLVEDGKVVRHEDRWDKKPLRNRENLPVLGRILEMSRRGSMLATHVLMGFGKDPFS